MVWRVCDGIAVFMKTASSWTWSQKPAFTPHLQQAKFSVCPQTHPFQYYPLVCTEVLKVGSELHICQLKFCVHFQSLPLYDISRPSNLLLSTDYNISTKCYILSVYNFLFLVVSSVSVANTFHIILSNASFTFFMPLNATFNKHCSYKMLSRKGSRTIKNVPRGDESRST